MTSHPDTPLRRILFACCGTHIIQDGLGALQYVLLPILAQSFGLSYAQVGLLRAISNSGTFVLEIPSGILAERTGERRLLVLGLAAAGIGYLGVAVSSSFLLIALFFFVTGVGGGFQHSLTSAVIVNSFNYIQRRRALGIYNASGDAGKLMFTGLFGLGLGAGFAWNTVVTVMGLVTIGFAGAVWIMLASTDRQRQSGEEISPSGLTGRWGIKRPRLFGVLGMVVFLDSIVQAVFLTFLAFMLLQKDVSASTASMAVVLALAGGMTGKFCCGFLTARYGDWKPFLFFQLLTMVGIVGLIIMPATALLIALPFIGLVVQGSSTVTYGAISDHIKASHQSRGFALIYTLANAASVVGPLVFGLIANNSSLDVAMWVLCGITALTLPLGGVLGMSMTDSVAEA
jgi:FSR family fosmidomycin resistance protein-like MFS transporter